MAHELVVVVEDEEEIQELVRHHLQRDGYQVRMAFTGEEGLALIRSLKPTLVLLDLMLPGIDGLTVCGNLKRDPDTREIPVVILTARGEDADIVAGLELGADDYVTKPFSPRVLVARLRSVLRRRTIPPPTEDEVLRRGPFLVDPGRHEVRLEDRVVPLTATEFRILATLMRRAGWVFSRDQIIQHVHGADYPVTDRSIDVQMVALRRKLGHAGEWLETVRGVGYRFRDRA